MGSYEQLFKKDKADFNDYLILFDLDTYYVEKLQISAHNAPQMWQEMWTYLK